MKTVLLGSQRHVPTVKDATRYLGIDGKIAVVTAGWQEREPEDEAIGEAFDCPTVNLHLHRRADEVFREDPVLASAYHDRQIAYRRIQDFYRIRLEHTLEAARMVFLRAREPELDDELGQSIDMLALLDQQHQLRCDRIRQQFRETIRPSERPSVARHRAELFKLLADCEALAIAGGHVATLLNRLQLFDVPDLWGDRPVFGWAAGAMVLTELIVLFHDDPPQGASTPQILDVGLGRALGVTVFPQPEKRLKVGLRAQMALYARRFAPRRCLILPRSSWVVVDDGRVEKPHGVQEIQPDGSVAGAGS